MAVRYVKGTTLLVSVTYEVLIEIDEDGVYNNKDLETEANAKIGALSQEGGLDGCLIECKVVSELTKDNDEEHDSKAAIELWDELREGMDHAKYPDLTSNQIQFVCDVIAAGLEEELRAYSGRGMFGRECPGVVVSHPSEVPTKVRYDQDSMGMNLIMYVS